MLNKIIKGRIVRIISFFCVFILFISTVSIVCNNNSDIIATNIKSFYNEENDSLDYIIIGSSAVMIDIFPTVVYKKNGITGNCVCLCGGDSRVYKSMLLEAIKTQKKAVYIFDIDGYTRDFIEDKEPIVNWIDSMEKKENWKNTIKELDNDNWAEHIFPLIKYHKMFLSPGRLINATQNIVKYDIKKETNSMKGAISRGENAYLSKDKMERLECFSWTSNKTTSLDEGQEENLKELINICKANNVKDAVFIDAPKAYYDKERKELLEQRSKKSNRCKIIIEQNGYKYFNYNSLDNPCRFNKEYFIDSFHLNQKGAVKYSEFFGNYLHKNYSFCDKKKEVILNWDKCTADTYELYGFDKS